jgi:hypothetical protein
MLAAAADVNWKIVLAASDSSCQIFHAPWSRLGLGMTLGVGVLAP